MCALWGIGKLGQLPLSVPAIERDLLAMIVSDYKYGNISPITRDTYISSWDGVAAWFGVRIVNHAVIVDKLLPNESPWVFVARYAWEDHAHYMVVDTDNNILYDPLGDWAYKNIARVVNYRVLYWMKPNVDYI